MPGRPSLPVPPKLVISEPVDGEANTLIEGKLATRRQTARSSPACKELGRSNLEWEDIDEELPRRRRRSRRTASGSGRPQAFTERKAEGDFGRFFPKLSRILETSESNISSRPGTKESHRSRQGDRSARRARHRDDTGSIYSRSSRQKSGGVQRRSSVGFKINPSLLSVLSGLTSTSDRSSGSNSTITQRSYNRRGSDTSRTPPARPRRPIMETESTASSVPPSRLPNVFDYMQKSSVGDSHDGHSAMSSSSSVSSHYQRSDAGSSEASGTPSSRSTFPSPTATRSGSVAELRRKYDQQYAAPSSSRGSSPRSSIRSLRRQFSVSDVLEDDDEEEEEEEEARMASPPVSPVELGFQSGHKHSYLQHNAEVDAEQHLRQQEEHLCQQTPYNQRLNQTQSQPHHIDPRYCDHQSESISSDRPAACAHQTALEHYHYPIPPTAPSPPAAAYTSPYQPSTTLPYPPPAPDAPDLRKRTIAGYEMVALEIASSTGSTSTTSSIKPLYRKFDYLHHRILLHLQDELAEMEEQLRTFDEIIAQLATSHSDTENAKPFPASRRAETYSGSGIHAQRIALLGRIFLKSEQYHRALRDYNDAMRDSRPAKEEEVARYEAFLARSQPIVEQEAQFLRHREDLVHPSRDLERDDSDGSLKTVVIYLPLLLTLPLLLFTLIPDLGGRLVVTVLLAAGAGMVAATTRVGTMLRAKEWAVCAGVYGLVMLGVAGCVPRRS